jgi:chromosome segregation ATPase
LSKQYVDDLMQSHSDLQRKLEAAEHEHAFALENSERLQSALQQRNEEITSLEDTRQLYHTELETLRSRLSSLDKEHTRTLSERARHVEELERQLAVHTERSTQLMNDTAERDVYLASLEEKAERRGEECDRMRRRMHELESESAAREVKLVELERDSERVREDNMNLNIALDSKQQELELVRQCHLPLVPDSDRFADQEEARRQRNWGCHTCALTDNKSTTGIIHIWRPHSSAANRIQQDNG